jgi:hypothetical protein
MNRRDLLKLGSAALMCVGRRPPVRRAAGGPRFLLVFLRGGYDATNLLIPYSSSLLLRIAPQHRDRQSPILRRTPAPWRSMPTGRSRPRCARPLARCICSGRRLSYRSPAPTICRAAISRPRTASNSASRSAAAATTAPVFSAGCPRPCRAPRQRRADCVHRRAAARVRRRGDRTRICRSRTSASRRSMSARRKF